jgi:hypothetical protein
VANDQGHLKVAEAGTDWPGKEDAEEETPQDGE